MTEPRILFATAVAAEAAPLAAALGMSEPPAAGAVARPPGSRAAILVAGIGRPSDAVFAAALDEVHPTVVVNFGFAGALDGDVEPGTILVADRWHAIDSPRVIIARPTERVTDDLATHLQAPRVAVMAADRALHDVSLRDRVARETGARIVEMEGGHWARLAAARHIPFCAVRVVSDHADRALPEHRHLLLTADGRVRWRRWLRAVLRNGRWYRPFWELRRLRRARRDWVSAVRGLETAAARLKGSFSVAPGEVVLDDRPVIEGEDLG